MLLANIDYKNGLCDHSLFTYKCHIAWVLVIAMNWTCVKEYCIIHDIVSYENPKHFVMNKPHFLSLSTHIAPCIAGSDAKDE